MNWICTELSILVRFFLKKCVQILRFIFGDFSGQKEDEEKAVKGNESPDASLSEEGSTGMEHHEESTGQYLPKTSLCNAIKRSPFSHFVKERIYDSGRIFSFIDSRWVLCVPDL